MQEHLAKSMWYAYIAGGLGVALGAVVLLGWYLHEPALIQVNPAFVPMQYNTALGFALGTRSSLRENAYPGEIGDAQGGFVWGGPRLEERDVRDVTEGTLSVDIFDVSDRTAVWHGWTTQTITDADRINPGDTVDLVIRSILAEFPPR